MAEERGQAWGGRDRSGLQWWRQAFPGAWTWPPREFSKGLRSHRVLPHSTMNGNEKSARENTGKMCKHAEITGYTPDYPMVEGVSAEGN